MVFGSLPTEILNITGCAARLCGQRCKNCVSLSLCHHEPKQEINKPFVSETTEFACICIRLYLHMYFYMYCIIVDIEIITIYNITCESNIISMHQKRYLQGLTKRLGMDDCKSKYTSRDSNINEICCEPSESTDEKLY